MQVSLYYNNKMINFYLDTQNIFRARRRQWHCPISCLHYIFKKLEPFLFWEIIRAFSKKFNYFCVFSFQWSFNLCIMYSQVTEQLCFYLLNWAMTKSILCVLPQNRFIFYQKWKYFIFVYDFVKLTETLLILSKLKAKSEFQVNIK